MKIQEKQLEINDEDFKAKLNLNEIFIYKTFLSKIIREIILCFILTLAIVIHYFHLHHTVIKLLI